MTCVAYLHLNISADFYCSLSAFLHFGSYTFEFTGDPRFILEYRNNNCQTNHKAHREAILDLLIVSHNLPPQMEFPSFHGIVLQMFKWTWMSLNMLKMHAEEDCGIWSKASEQLLAGLCGEIVFPINLSSCFMQTKHCIVRQIQQVDLCYHRFR